MKKLVIAIDGPAGAGKTTIAKGLAKRLDIPFFSTGAMYRALALKCAQNGLDATDENVARDIAKNTELGLEYKDGKQYVILDGKDVTDKLYTDQISTIASQISVHRVIREKLVKIQRDVAKTQSVIMDGRDIGSVVIPMANYKFYLDADVKVRAKRRYDELVSKGEVATFEEVLDDLKERDYRDKTREISPLVISKDAIIIDSTNMTVDEVIDKFLEYVK